MTADDGRIREDGPVTGGRRIPSDDRGRGSHRSGTSAHGFRRSRAAAGAPGAPQAGPILPPDILLPADRDRAGGGPSSLNGSEGRRPSRHPPGRCPGRGRRAVERVRPCVPGGSRLPRSFTSGRTVPVNRPDLMRRAPTGRGGRGDADDARRFRAAPALSTQHTQLRIIPLHPDVLPYPDRKHTPGEGPNALPQRFRPGQGLTPQRAGSPRGPRQSSHAGGAHGPSCPDGPALPVRPLPLHSRGCPGVADAAAAALRIRSSGAPR